MIVCVCNAIRERELKEVARDEAGSLCSLYERLGCRPKCGQCLPFAREILNRAAPAGA